MTELPKDKATFKVSIKSHESFHTDSTLDTASLSSSSHEESPSGIQTRQLPQPFIIPTFSFDVELKLRQGNEVYYRDGTLLDIKRHEIRHLGQVSRSYTHSPYPRREELDHVV